MPAHEFKRLNETDPDVQANSQAQLPTEIHDEGLIDFKAH